MYFRYLSHCVKWGRPSKRYTDHSFATSSPLSRAYFISAISRAVFVDETGTIPESSRPSTHDARAPSVGSFLYVDHVFLFFLRPTHVREAREGGLRRGREAPPCVLHESNPSRFSFSFFPSSSLLARKGNSGLVRFFLPPPLSVSPFSRRRNVVPLCRHVRTRCG